MTATGQVLAYLPSPPSGVVHLGPLPIRAYALAILLGVVVAVLLGERRWVARGGTRGIVTDVATWAVPGGIVGARIYHVITSPAVYLDDPVRALYIWKGGLGIPGGVAGGVLVGYLVCRRRGIAVGALADAIAPGVAVAQAIGRFGNYFNQELFGRPTTLPWGLTIAPDNPDAVPGAVAYHPTFLYESLWDLGVAMLVLTVDRRRRLGGGRAFALYLAVYAVGRFWIEGFRIDEASSFAGLRLNEYVMLVVFAGAVAFLFRRRHVGREDPARVAVPGPLSARGDADERLLAGVAAGRDGATATALQGVDAAARPVHLPPSSPSEHPGPAGEAANLSARTTGTGTTSAGVPGDVRAQTPAAGEPPGSQLPPVAGPSSSLSDASGDASAETPAAAAVPSPVRTDVSGDIVAQTPAPGTSGLTATTPGRAETMPSEPPTTRALDPTLDVPAVDPPGAGTQPSRHEEPQP